MRGQPVDSNCPECGLVVSRSARHDLLRYSDRAWLIAVANGFVPLMFCAALALLHRVAYAYGLHLYINAMTAARSNAHFRALIWFSLACTLAINAFALCGVWMITRREPNKVLEPTWLRPLARRCMLAVFVLTLALSIPWLTFQTTGIRLSTGQAIVVIIQIACGVCLLIAIAALFVLARCLAFRIPDEPLARRTMIAAIGIIAIMVFQAFHSWTDFFGFFPISGEASRYLRHVPQAIVTVWAITLLIQYRTRIRAAASALA